MCPDDRRRRCPPSVIRLSECDEQRARRARVTQGLREDGAHAAARRERVHVLGPDHGCGASPAAMAGMSTACGSKTTATPRSLGQAVGLDGQPERVGSPAVALEADLEDGRPRSAPDGPTLRRPRRRCRASARGAAAARVQRPCAAPMWWVAPARSHASHQSAIASVSCLNSVWGAEIGRGGNGRNSPSEITNRHCPPTRRHEGEVGDRPGLVGELEAGPEAVDALVVDRVLDLDRARRPERRVAVPVVGEHDGVVVEVDDVVLERRRLAGELLEDELRDGAC